MAINYYGMPMTESSVALDTLFNLLEQGSVGGERIFLDADISEKIYSMADIETKKYKEIAELAEREFDIKPPSPEKCASVGSWIGQCIGAAFSGLFSFSTKILVIAAVAALIFFTIK